MNHNEKEHNVLGIIILACLAVGTVGGFLFGKLVDGLMLGAITALVIGVIYEVVSLAKQNTE